MKPATKTIKQISITSLLLLAALFSNKSSVNAQASTGLSAIPPKLEINAQPDGANTQVLKVRNESQETKTIKVSIRDFIVTDDKGTPNFIDNLSENLNNRWAASSWIQVSPSTLTVKPGETKSLTLTVLAPANALPGGHYASVVYSPESASLYNSITGASIQTNVGTLVYITVPGDINQGATIQSFTAPKFSEFGPIDFKATIKNSSDIHIQPVGSINIKGWFGQETKLTLKETNIFPYTIRNFENTLDKKWLFGRYKATLNAVYGTAGGLITATVFFWVIPWRLLILVGAAIAIIVTLIIIFKNKSKKSPNNSTDEVTQLEKELETLKKKYKDQ